VCDPRQSLGSLCAALGTLSAMVKRLIRFLRDNGTPIEFDPENGGYVLDRANAEVVGRFPDSHRSSTATALAEIDPVVGGGCPAAAGRPSSAQSGPSK
jgi:predicted DNA-binding transcriptional regulator YafY